VTDTPTPASGVVARRTVLAGGAAAGAAAFAAAAEGATNRYFKHGVASGDPLPRAVVLWTRLTPTAAATPGSGSGPAAKGTWQVATDRDFRHVVSQGSWQTGPGRDHTIKVDATGLAPARWYYYRFRYRGGSSRVGRTRTAPAADATPANVRFGVVSCANLQAGWFSAYRHLAKRDDLHAILHLGDYLYEYGPGEYGYGQGNVDVRRHAPAHEMISLADYRRRHAQYKRDADLQNLHARYPFIVTWDDHESANDAWRGGAENHQPAEGNWGTRRARAHRAYDEWMPVRMSGTAALGDGTRLFRRLRFGTLAELSMLDLRTYRSKQAAYPLVDGSVSDPDRTIAGDAQLAWLKTSLSQHRALWKVVGNPVMITPITLGGLPADLVDSVNDVAGLLPADGAPYNVDQWDGYTHDRRQIFRHLRDHGVENTVFVTGDIHSGWAADLPVDKALYPLTETVGVEFVATSVTSNNLKDILGTPRRTASLAVEGIITSANRHVKYLNFDDHGFSILDLTARRAQMDYYVIGERTNKAAGVTWTASWATTAGTQRVHAVSKPVAP
jgi:alkaline phosphatase D